MRHTIEHRAASERAAVPERFQKFYPERDGVLVNSCFADSRPLERVHWGTAPEGSIVIPRIQWSSNPDDLRLSATARYGRWADTGGVDDDGNTQLTFLSFDGLEAYCVYTLERERPVYVCDNHSVALFAWQEAREAGALRPEAALVHLDAHFDLDTPAVRAFAPIDRTQVSGAFARGDFGIASFIEPALRSGLVGDIIVFHGTPTMDITNERMLTALGSEGTTIRQYRDAGRLHDVTGAVLANPSALTERMAQLHESGRSIILDIDFDLFNPLLSTRGLEVQSLLPALAAHADIITCATSPDYGNQAEAIALVRSFIREITPTS